MEQMDSIVSQISIAMRRDLNRTTVSMPYEKESDWKEITEILSAPIANEEELSVCFSLL